MKTDGHGFNLQRVPGRTQRTIDGDPTGALAAPSGMSQRKNIISQAKAQGNEQKPKVRIHISTPIIYGSRGYRISCNDHSS